MQTFALKSFALIPRCSATDCGIVYKKSTSHSRCSECLHGIATILPPLETCGGYARKHDV